MQRLGLLESLDRLDLENPINVVIPVGREVAELAAARGWNARLCSPELYFRLDHKGSMTSLEFPNTIPQIPTYVIPPTLTSIQADLSEFRAFASQFEAVIIKPADRAGSQGQRICSREQGQRICSREQIRLDTVVQPYFKDHVTVEFNFFALNGQLIEWLCTYASGGITEDMWTNGTSLQTYDGEELNRMVSFVRDAIRLHQLHGLMEFEFLISGGQLFFLEINPRISSSVAGFDSDGCSPYIEKLVVPCLQSFGLLKGKELTNWHASCISCPPDGHAKKFWQETYQKDWTSRISDVRI
eukprot:gnl/TRDRNA2_/TRDRNA2_177152_c1_seq39.p1 gnl/TRDRNA2_/TRDRNA2_177152_c1~~gnl/TRDRNA2_/TRDRNA2_177152_c1_seq39.p1  ORF type:complete len:299 (-),score=24.78 gnl/TRDRNA2_/TRDRNA2_177152_c1_seq39:414-1310(-)